MRAAAPAPLSLAPVSTPAIGASTRGKEHSTDSGALTAAHLQYMSRHPRDLSLHVPECLCWKKIAVQIKVGTEMKGPPNRTTGSQTCISSTDFMETSNALSFLTPHA